MIVPSALENWRQSCRAARQEPRPLANAPIILCHIVCCLVLSVLVGRVGTCGEPIAEGDLYAKRIQPLLERHCYECHSEKADELKGNLRLDKYDLILKGGNNGQAVIPGDNNSFLLRAIRYQEDDYKMPPRAKLPADEIMDFERWVKLGAHGPKEPPKPKAPVSSGRRTS